jgi:hypothetical protein
MTLRSRRVRSRMLGALVGGLLAGIHATGHTAPSDAARMRARLDPATAASVQALVDEAAAKGLPTHALFLTALEGAARGADPARILTVVRTQISALRIARTALSVHATEAELIAGASAVRAGVSGDSLGRLHVSRGRSLVVPLVVMGDLIARGIPPAMASGALIATTQWQVPDKVLLRFREAVAEDIRAGASPSDAIAVQTEVLRLGMEIAPEDLSPLHRRERTGALPR